MILFEYSPFCVYFVMVNLDIDFFGLMFIYMDIVLVRPIF